MSLAASESYTFHSGMVALDEILLVHETSFVDRMARQIRDVIEVEDVRGRYL